MVNESPTSATVRAMAASIALLPEHVIDQIAAGEVIERPASVLRELIDNALDAEARRIVIDIQGGGVEAIVVLDDGQGMTPEDAKRSILRHATSKIRTLSDLKTLQSRGFRGEALASISAVSRFVLTTRAAHAEIATELSSEGGTLVEPRTAAGQPGTKVEVRDLFFNIPARRKFLKSTPTETAHIHKCLIRAALSRPDVRFELRRDGVRSKLFAATDAMGRVEQVFGESTVKELVAPNEGSVAVRAYLAAPERARSGAGSLHIFVNGRPVIDSALARSVAFAYGSVLPPGKYPLGAVHLNIDPELVDINVHPQKLEVRFSDGREVYETLTRKLATLLGTTPWSRVDAKKPTAWRQKGASSGPSLSDYKPRPSAQDTWATLSILRDATSHLQVHRQHSTFAESKGAFASLRPIAQLQSLFILCEGQSGLYIIDQHAADERVRFSKLRRAFDSRELQIQRLLFPAQVDVGEEALGWLSENAEALSSLGIDATPLSDSELLVRALPAIVANGDPAALTLHALRELQREADRNWSDHVDTALATMACHAALRRGDRISLKECSALLAELDASEAFKEHCPHGRPVVFTISYDELEAKLGR